MDSPEELARSFLQAVGYAEDTRVRAVFLIGSTASGLNDVYSDIDITVAVTSTIPRGERLRRLVGVGCHDIMLTGSGV